MITNVLPPFYGSQCVTHTALTLELELLVNIIIIIFIFIPSVVKIQRVKSYQNLKQNSNNKNIIIIIIIFKIVFI